MTRLSDLDVGNTILCQYSGVTQAILPLATLRNLGIIRYRFYRHE